jgi:hypothetical protein
MEVGMSSSSMEAVGIAVVLGVVAVAALASLFRRPRGPRSGRQDDDHR